MGLWLASALGGPNKRPQAPLERRLADWPVKLTDLDGHVHCLGQTAGCKAIALIFLGQDCPISNGALPGLARLNEAYAEKGVEFYGVMADPSITREAARTIAMPTRSPFRSCSTGRAA